VICRPQFTSAFSGGGFISKGFVRCVEVGNGSGTTLNAFLGTAAGGFQNMTNNEPRRCSDGAKIGQPCQTSTDCPGGVCRSPQLRGCAADSRGKRVFFIFDGNPTGGNGDLGDELFAFDTKKGALSQVTNQTGWCSDDSSKTCTSSAGCGTTGTCIQASMSDLEVSPDGKIVSFVSDGSPAEVSNNTGHHGSAFFTFVSKGKGKGNRLVGGGEAFCAPNTSNRGAACTKESDCGTVCGNGRKEGSEQCDGGGYAGGGCPVGQFCAPPGSANQCTCQTPVCGNGIREGTEECDGPGTCGPNEICNAQCQCVVM